MSELIDCRNDLTAEMILRAIARKDNGNIYLTTKGLSVEPAFGAEFQAVYDSWAVKPTEADALLMNTMVASLVSTGVWAKLDIFDVFAVHAEAEALTNWINPGTNDPTNVHATVWDAFEGYTGDGANDYINTNYNPGTDAINYALDDASGGVYIRTDNNNSEIEIASTAGAVAAIQMNVNEGGDAYLKLNSNGFVTDATGDSRGMWIATRVNATDADLFRNKVKVIDGTLASTSIANSVTFILARSNTGTPSVYSTKQISMAFMGSGFTQQNIDDLTDAFEIYADAKGFGVIP